MCESGPGDFPVRSEARHTITDMTTDADAVELQDFTGTTSYLTNPALEAAVRCALVLEKPLLVRGEPGTGKTLLAEAVAEAEGLELITWNVKSTTRAQDGLCLLYTSPSPRDRTRYRMPSSA